MNRIKALKTRIHHIVLVGHRAGSCRMLVKIHIVSADLPPGVCPFDRSRWLTYSAFGVLLASLAFFFPHRLFETQTA